MAFNNLGTPVWVDSGADIFWWYLSNTQSARNMRWPTASPPRVR